METRETRLKRNGVLLKRARKDLGYRRVDDLAEAAGIGRTTVVAIENGRKTVTSAMYNALEIAIRRPLGTMERVIAGEIDEYPPADSADGRAETTASEPAYEVDEKVYTESELRGIAKALGPEEFRNWALGHHPHEGRA